MGRKLKPIFSKYEATTQTSLASTVYDGQPGDPVELHHVVYPTVKQVSGKIKGRKAQSAHGPSAYKKSGGYSKFKVKSPEVKAGAGGWPHRPFRQALGQEEEDPDRSQEQDCLSGGFPGSWTENGLAVRREVIVR